MQVQSNALRVDGKPAFIIIIGKTHIRFDGEMRLPLRVKRPFGCVSRGCHKRFGVFSFHHALRKINIRCSGVNLDRIIRHGFRRVHIRGQLFQFNPDLFCRGERLRFGIRADDSDRVSILKYFLVAQDGAVPAVTPIGFPGYQPVDTIFPLDIFISDYLEHTGHFLRFSSIYLQNIRVAHFRLNQRQV